MATISVSLKLNEAIRSKTHLRIGRRSFSLLLNRGCRFVFRRMKIVKQFLASVRWTLTWVVTLRRCPRDPSNSALRLKKPAKKPAKHSRNVPQWELLLNFLLSSLESLASSELIYLIRI